MDPYEVEVDLEPGQASGEPSVGGLPMEPPAGAIARLEDQLAELTDRHMRLAAEFDNYRKRSVRERAEASQRAQAQLTARVLDVLDDIDRLLAAPSESLTVDSLREAVTLVDRKLWKELREAGLERVDPTGEPFDPALHEAVATLPTPEGVEEHTVAATFQAGYTFQGALVRPARVQVYSGGSSA